MTSPLDQFSDWEYRHLAALGHKVGGPDIARKLLTRKTVEVTFSDDGHAKIVAHEPMFTVWKTITIGTGIAKDQFGSKLKDGGFYTHNTAADLMKHDAFTVADAEEHIGLIIASVADFGFNKTTRFNAILPRAKERGLELCPAEVGPQLRLRYADQPLDERLVVAMKPICDSNGNLCFFFVDHGYDGLELNWLGGHPDSSWRLATLFVWRAARQQPSDASVLRTS